MSAAPLPDVEAITSLFGAFKVATRATRSCKSTRVVNEKKFVGSSEDGEFREIFLD